MDKIGKAGAGGGRGGRGFSPLGARQLGQVALVRRVGAHLLRLPAAAAAAATRNRRSRLPHAGAVAPGREPRLRGGSRAYVVGSAAALLRSWATEGRQDLETDELPLVRSHEAVGVDFFDPNCLHGHLGGRLL